jgi:L-lactate dehydrogenase complex protein LldG
MSGNREQMLQHIREAAVEGNRAGGSPPLPERGRVGYQGAGADAVARFGVEFAAAGGQLHVVGDHAAATALVIELVRTRSIRRVLVGQSEVLDALRVVEPLRAEGVEVVTVGTAEARERATLFAAELGLSGVDYLIAETGSVVLASRPEQPRSLSLLPPLHIALAERRQLLPDLFDLFALLGAKEDSLPACVSVITGPSKTGDIELRLVHGPGEVHVILISGDRGQEIKVKTALLTPDS